MRNAILAAISGAILAAAPASAAQMNDLLTCATKTGALQCSSSKVYLGSGNEFALSRNGARLFLVNFSGNQLLLTALQGGTGSTDLVSFTDFDNPFHYFGLISNNGFNGFSSTDVELQDNTASFRLSPSISFSQGATLVFAVPEIASWAMMIGGVGVIGFAMRSRKRHPTRVTFA